MRVSKNSSRAPNKNLKDLKKLRIPSGVVRKSINQSKSLEGSKSNPKFKKMPKLKMGKNKFKNPATPCDELNLEYETQNLVDSFLSSKHAKSTSYHTRKRRKNILTSNFAKKLIPNLDLNYKIKDRPKSTKHGRGGAKFDYLSAWDTLKQDDYQIERF